jgi:hypothetical protein
MFGLEKSAKTLKKSQKRPGAQKQPARGGEQKTTHFNRMTGQLGLNQCVSVSYAVTMAVSHYALYRYSLRARLLLLD